jgi:hypothetical protein
MTAEPIEAYEPDPDDPVEILRILPQEYHEYFWAEYRAASAATVNPERYRDLRSLLLWWRLRAEAYSAPGYEERLAAAFDDSVDASIPAEDVIPGWSSK